MLSYLPRAIALFALASSIAASAARADDYPSRPVKIIAPFGAGGPTDVFTRDIAEDLRKALHQTFYIENRPGAGTTSRVQRVLARININGADNYGVCPPATWRCTPRASKPPTKAVRARSTAGSSHSRK